MKKPDEFIKFSEEVVYIKSAWAILDRMFFDVNAKHDQKIFDKSGSNVWRYYLFGLLSYVVQALCRLTDKLETGKHKNFTIEFVWNKIDAKYKNLDATKLKRARVSKDSILQFFKSNKKFKNLRDKYLDHNDLSVFMVNGKNSDLPINDIKEGVWLLKKFHDQCEVLFKDSEVKQISAEDPSYQIDVTGEQIKKEVDSLLLLINSGINK